LFDFVIGVAEGHAETEGEAAADGGFAGAHEADEDDRAGGRGSGRLGGRVRRVWARQGAVACHRGRG
jgi:hypothetical protein